MPFLSKAQRAWMYKNKPKMAKEWEKDTPKGASLPDHVDGRPLTHKKSPPSTKKKK